MRFQLFTDSNATSAAAIKMFKERMISFEVYPKNKYGQVCVSALLRAGTNEFPILKANKEYISGKKVIEFIRDLRFGGE